MSVNLKTGRLACFPVVVFLIGLLLIPHEALGRFSSASRVLTWGIDPIGATPSGVLALFLPTGAVLAVPSSGVVISACWIASSAAVRELPLLSEIEQCPE